MRLVKQVNRLILNACEIHESQNDSALFLLLLSKLETY